MGRDSTQGRAARNLLRRSPVTGYSSSRMTAVRHFTCNLCEALCGLRVTVDGGARHRHPRRPGRRLLARPHLPQGPGAARAARGPRPAARARAAHRRGVGADRVGRGARPRRAAGLRDVQRRHGRDAVGALHRQPDRAQPPRLARRAGARARAAHAEPLRPQLAGLEPAPLRVHAGLRRRHCRSPCPTSTAPRTSSSSAPTRPRRTAA